jgi:glycosyltransferase involved in cell wall biosynthesis
MRFPDLVLWQHLAARGKRVIVVASSGTPAWLGSLGSSCTVVKALDSDECGSAPTVVLLDGPHAVGQETLAALHETQAEVLYWHGGLWRVRCGDVRPRLWMLRELVRHVLPFVSQWSARLCGVVRLQPPFQHVAGACYWASLGSLRVPEPGDDAQAVLFEDGKPLPLRDCVHQEIFDHGGGRYSVWNHDIYFSTPDGSDPTTNGRVYEVQVTQKSPDTRLGAPNDEQQFAALFRAMAQRRPASAPRGKRVMLLIGSLAAGGAERQLCYLGKGLASRGYEVAIASLDGLGGAAGHYVALLDGTGVRLVDASLPGAVEPGALEQRAPGALALLQRMPDVFAVDAWRVATHVAQFAPDILHCSLDTTNLLGAIAGTALGVPRIVLSMRNHNPTNFPYLDRPWFRRWYEIAATVPGLVLSANSAAGGADYAAWLALPRERVHIVLNGFDATAVAVPADDEVRALRAEHGIGDADPVVAGVFRLSAEKRPLLWLDVVLRLKQRFPRLRVLHAGVGPDLEAVKERVRELGLQDTVVLLGRRSDTNRVIRAADLLLLVSTLEGLPNVVLEAQWLERPVVCTAAGGSVEAVQDGVTGFVIAGTQHGLEQEIEQACARLLADADLRARMGRAGREWVATRFAVDVMVERSIALYGDSAAK